MITFCFLGPECVTNSDCPQHLACRNQRCEDPCPGTCGYLAECKVVQHSAYCTCIVGHTGDPFLGCRPIPPPPPLKIEPVDPCYRKYIV